MKRKTWMIFGISFVMAALIAGCAKKEETTKKATTKEETTVTSQEKETTTTTEETTTEATTTAAKKKPEGEVQFTAKDREGNEYDASVFSGHKVTMLNFFEPWCGPCVGEIPELQKLSETYDAADFQIIGIYNQYPDAENEAMMEELLKSTKISYLVLNFSKELQPLTSEYVPTTVFVDENGNVIQIEGEDKQVIGALDEAGWKKLIDKAIAQVSK